MMSIGSVKSAGSAGNYYTDKDNYYVIGSMGERWAGKGAEALGLSGGWTRRSLRRFWRDACRTAATSAGLRTGRTNTVRATTSPSLRPKVSP